MVAIVPIRRGGVGVNTVEGSLVARSFVPTPFRLDQWRSGTASPWTMVVVQRDHP